MVVGQRTRSGLSSTERSTRYYCMEHCTSYETYSTCTVPATEETKDGLPFLSRGVVRRDPEICGFAGRQVKRGRADGAPMRAPFAAPEPA